MGASFHPDEHPLALGRPALVDLDAAASAMGDRPTFEVHDDFIVYPL